MKKEKGPRKTLFYLIAEFKMDTFTKISKEKTHLAWYFGE